MRTRNIIAAGLLALAALAGPAAILPGSVALAADKAPKNEPFGRLTIDEVEAKLKDAKAGKLKLYVYDNNNRDRYQKGHLPGARWLDYSRIQASDLPKEKDALLVFYCANEQCHACHEGAVSALKLGYTNVYIMPAGIMGWEKANKAVEKG